MLLAERTLIVNQVLMSSVWYIIVVRVGLKKVLRKIKALLCNYRWFGYENMARAHVS